MKPFNRESPGRLRLEVDQPALLSTIVDIVQGTSAADNIRRTAMLRTVTKLDDLVSELRKQGLQISRSATYLRLVPRYKNSELLQVNHLFVCDEKSFRNEVFLKGNK